MKKSILKKTFTLMMLMVTIFTFSIKISFAATKPVNSNINEQQLIKTFENDKYIIYEQQYSSGELDLDIEFSGEIKSRAIPNHVGSKITQMDGNRVKVVSRNYGVDTVDRVRISAFMTNVYGFSSRNIRNEYNIRPFFYRTNIFNYRNWQTMSFNIEVWDGGQYGSKFETIVRKK